MLSILTCQLHEVVEILNGKHRLPEFSEVKFKHPGHGVDVRRIADVGQRILAPLEGIAEVVDLDLGGKVGRRGTA